MLLVDGPGKAAEPILCPWVRVARRESRRGAASGSRFYSVDVVHAAYLESFVSDHLLPFIDQLAQRIVTAPWILKGQGTVADFDHWSWRDVQEVR
jgi:hypothetical protein